jgi:hypothetical protein
LEMGRLEVQMKPGKAQTQQNNQLINAIGSLTGGILTIGFVASGAYLFVNGYNEIAYCAWGIAFLASGWFALRKKA